MNNWRPAANFTSSASGNWNDPATWGGAGVPAPGDDVKISSNHVVVLDTNRSVRNFNLDYSSGLDLNGFRLDIEGDGSVFTYNGGLRNSNAVLGTVNFVGNWTMGGVTQVLSGTNGGCPSSNTCNLEIRLTSSVTVRTVKPAGSLFGASLFNVNLAIHSGSVLDLTEEMRFIGLDATTRVINNSGTIRNGKLTVERLVAIGGDGGVFDADLGIVGTTFTSGLFRRDVSGGNLILTGDIQVLGDVTFGSGSVIDLNGKSLRLLGNNRYLSNNGTISSSTGAATIRFTGNGAPGGVVQSMYSVGEMSNDVSVRLTDSVTLRRQNPTSTFTTMSRVIVENGSTLDLTGISLYLHSPGTPLAVDGSIITNNSTVVMAGTAPQVVQSNLNGAGYHNLTINNPSGVSIPASGGNVIIPGTLTLSSGAFAPNGNLTLGNAATIARNQGSLVGVPNFGTSINLRYFGSGTIVPGPEIPTSNSLQNLHIEAIGAMSITLSSDLTVNGNFSVLQGVTLAGQPGTSLFLKGPSVINVGSITHPSVTFNSSGNQTVNGPAGTWTGASLTMASAGTITFENGANFANATLVNSSTINTGSNFMSFKGGRFVNNGVVNGNFQVPTFDAEVIFEAGDSGFNAAFHVFNRTTRASGRVNSTLTVGSTLATLQVDAGQTFTVGGGATINGPITGGGTLRVNGTFVSNSAPVSIASFQLGGGTQALSGNGAYVGNTVSILNGSSTTLNTNKQMARVAVESGGTFNFANRTLFLSGSGIPFTNAGTILHANSTVEFNGTEPQSLSPSVQSFPNLSSNNTAGVTGFAGLTVTNLLRINAGSFATTGGTFKDIQIDNVRYACRRCRYHDIAYRVLVEQRIFRCEREHGRVHGHCGSDRRGNGIDGFRRIDYRSGIRLEPRS